jgi:addiction module RelB/DinJ family antitoxin
MSTTKVSDTTVISVKVEKDLKAKAQAVARRFGIPLSTLLGAYMHELVETGQIYFTAVEVATPETERILAQAEKEIAAGETSGPFETAEEAIEHLKSL